MEPTDRIGLTQAAKLMQELGICKAFGPSGKVNGPNCQRFGHRDAVTGRWWWSVSELEEIARKRGTAPSDTQGRGTPMNRAQVERDFRESLRELESSLRKAVGGGPRDTFGILISKAEKQKMFTRPQLAELSFINVVRNALYHASDETVEDNQLHRALVCVKAWVAAVVPQRTQNRRGL